MALVKITQASSAAPSCTGQAGSLISMLDYALVNGDPGNQDPIGSWEKVAGNSTEALYRSTNVLSSGMCLHVDDRGSGGSGNDRYARIRGYETATTLEDKANPFPTIAQKADGAQFTCIKSYSADATVRPWAIWGDDFGFLVAIQYYPSQTYPHGFMFTDFDSFIAGDSYNCLLHGAVTTSYTSTSAYGPGSKSSTSYTSVARDDDLLVGGTWAGLHGGHFTNGTRLGDGSLENDAVASSRAMFTRVLIATDAANKLRGRMRQVYDIMTDHAHADFTFPITNIDGATGVEIDNFIYYTGSPTKRFFPVRSDDWPEPVNLS